MRIGSAVTLEGTRIVALDIEGNVRELADPAITFTDLVNYGVAAVTLGAIVAGPRLRTPVSPGKIVAIGLNYLDHVREMGGDVTVPDRPLVFAKFPSCVVSDGDPIEVGESLTQRVDWEVELAVVIGRQAKHVRPEDALDHVFGYLVANDVSARDLQFADGQWIRGKNLDGFCPLGSWVVTADEIPDPQALSMWTTVNGVVKQASSTGEMIFGVAELIAFCSESFTLHPGDLLLTGTPWGCGEFMSTRESLRDGDVVRVGVDGLGDLTNSIRVRRRELAKSGEPT